MKNKKGIFIFIILHQITTGNTLHCGNSLIKHKEPGFINDISPKRNLEEIEYNPIRIKVDYTQLKLDTELYPEIFDIIKSSLDSAIDYFESIIKVEYVSIEELSHTSYENECNIDNVDEDIINWSNNYDLILFPSFDYDNPVANVYASAYACYLLKSNNRPLAGRIYIQNNFDFKKNNIKIFLQNILFHEITHVFVFDPFLLRRFNAIKTVYKNDESISVISTPKVLEKARLHFNCNELDGVPLENEGGAGSENSHWESRYMLGDYMISNNYYEVVISDITLALFEDSGWYKVNYYTGGLFRFGKNIGCDFFEKKCIENRKSIFPNEFCHSKKEPKCLNSHLGMGECYIMEYEKGEIPSKYRYFKDEKLGGQYYMEFCPVSDMYLQESTNISYLETSCKYGDSLDLFEHYGEVIGSNSICFESSLVPRYSPQPYKWRTICYPISCDRKNKKVIVYVNDLSVVCPTKGGTLKNIKGFKGKINCPDYNLICTSKIWCNDMYDCIDKQSIADESTYYSYIGDNSESDL